MKSYPDTDDTIRPNETKVLLALISEHRGVPITVRQLALITSLPLTVAYEALRWLRTCGLVDWRDGQSGTLHATSRAVALRPYDHRERDALRVGRAGRPVRRVRRS